MSNRLRCTSFLALVLISISLTARAQEGAIPELVPQMGPDGDCGRLAFSRDGRFVATSGTANGTTIQVWDTATGSLVRNLRSQSGEFSLFHGSTTLWEGGELDFSPDGKYLAFLLRRRPIGKTRPLENSGPVDEPPAYVWDLASGRAMVHSRWTADTAKKTLLNKDIPWTIDEIESWGSALAEAATQWGQKHPRGPNSKHSLYDAHMALSSDGRFFARVDGYGDLWDVHAERQISGFCDSRILPWKSLSLSADGKLMAAASRGKEFIVWNLEKSEAPLAADAVEELKSIAISPDSQRLATGMRGDDRDGKGHLVFNGQTALWDEVSLRKLHPLNGDPLGADFAEATAAVAFSRDGSRLVAAMVSIDQQATGGDDVAYQGLLKMWDPTTGKLIWKRALPDSELSAVAFSPDGRFVATGHQGILVKLYDVAAGSRVRFFSDKQADTKGPLGGDSAVLSLAFSPDGKMLASGGSTGHLYVWDDQTGKPLAHLSEVHVDGDAEVAYEFGADPGPRPSATRQSVEAVVFSSDGKRLYSARCDGTITVWDTATWKQLSVLSALQDRCVRALALSPDGKWLISAGEDGQVLFWDAASDRLSARLLIGADPNQWLVVSEDGLFDGTDEGIRTLAAWRVQNRLVSFTLLPAEFRVNGLLHKILSRQAPASRVNLRVLLEKR